MFQKWNCSLFCLLVVNFNFPRMLFLTSNNWNWSFFFFKKFVVHCRAKFFEIETDETKAKPIVVGFGFQESCRMHLYFLDNNFGTKQCTGNIADRVGKFPTLTWKKAVKRKLNGEDWIFPLCYSLKMIK